MKVRIAAMAAIIAAGVTTRASAQTATQTVSFEVQAINEIAVSGSPSLLVSSAVAGNAPTAATASASYAITTNEVDRKITAELDADMPAGLTLPDRNDRLRWK